MTARAIIAGRGGLPAAVAAALQGQPPLIAAMEGFLPDGLTPDLTFRLERLMPFIRALVDHGVEEVAFAGAIRRPRLDPSLFDPETATLVPRILAAMARGDDGALSEAIAVIEEAGLAVRGIGDLAPGLLPGAGLWAGSLTPAAERDAARARAIHAALSPADIGQGCVVAGGQCLAVEALPGTDAMLSGLALIDPAIRPAEPGLFYKAAKIGQDLRIDLPVLGPATVEAVARAGLGGLCWQGGTVICLDFARMQAIAADKGLFLWAH